MNDIISGDYIIDHIDDNKSFAVLTLRSETGVIQATVKDNVEMFIRSYKAGDIVACKTKVRSNNIHDIVSLTRSKKSVKGFDFDEWKERFEKLWNSVTDVDYKAILDSMFGVEVIYNEFLSYPAAKQNHHSYPHGLLKHSTEVGEIADFLYKYTNKGSRDLCIAGALLHDIGKLRAYDIDELGNIENSHIGKLVGHLPLSALFVSKVIPDNIPEGKSELLYHLILSHHGKKEWGSPIEPMTIEAMILHQADIASCNIEGIGKMQAEKDGWTNNYNMFKRTFFLGDNK